MRVLLSGGIKTKNIITSIEKKFESSGDDLFVVEYIEDIDNIFALGNYFDKAIIVEQSITHDGRDTDEDTLRRKINQFSKECEHRGRDESFVFLTGSNEMAEMINDETLEIHDKSAIILKEAPYKTKFFALLITIDIPNIPSNLLYQPPVEYGLAGVTDEVPDLSGIPDDELDPVDDGYHPIVVNDFDNIFDSGESTGARISDEFTPDFGTEFMPENNEGEQNTQASIEDEFDAFDLQQNNTVNESGLDDRPEVNWNDNDQIIDNEVVEEGYGPSGEIPDYTEMDMTGQNAENATGDTGMTDGFDFDFGGEQGQAQGGFQFDDNSDNGSQGGFMFDEQDNMQDDYSQSGFIDETQQSYGTEENSQADYGYSTDDMFGYNDNNNEPDVGMTGMAGMAGAYGALNEDVTPDNSFNQQQADYQGYGDYQNYNNNQQQQQYDNNDYNQDNQWSPDQDIFDQSNYRNDNEDVSQLQLVGSNDPSDKDIKKKLEAFAARGNSICVTGCGGCGTSTVAFNIANTLANLGYNVLLVDFDTECRTQNYISSDCYKSMDPDGANLMAAVNSGQGINTHTSVVKRGLHLLTMGIGGDADKPENLLNESKVSRFINLAKTSHNFVIYDVPFDSATGFLSEAVYLADNLVLVTEVSTHGVIKTMLKVCNINEQDMQDMFFSKAQIVFNKYRNLNKLLGKKVKSAKDITKIMDDTVFDLIGEDNGLYFSSMHIAGILEDDPNYEFAWFERVQYSDTPKGKKIYKELIEKIVTHK